MAIAAVQIAKPPRSSFASVALTGVLAAVALLGILPFVWSVHMLPLPSFDSEVVAAFCLGFALLCSGPLKGPAAKIRWPLPLFLLSLCTLVSLQQALGMLAYSQLAVRFYLYTACVLLAYVLGRRLLATGHAAEATRYFCGAMLIGGLYTVLVQWLQMLDLEVLPPWMAAVFKDPVVQTRPFGNLGQANHADTYIAMAAFCALYLGKRAPRDAWFVAPSLMVTACGLALTGSRMGIAFLALLMATLFAPTALRPLGLRQRWAGLAALLAGYAAGLIAIRIVAGEFDTLTRFSEHSWPIRVELLRQAWVLSLQHPLLGLGVGQFASGSYWIARPGPYSQLANNCHNLILELAVEFGWPAGVAVCGLAVSWFWRDLRARLAQPESAFAIAILLLLGIHSMLEFPLWYLFFALPAALLFGLAEPEWDRYASVDVRRILPMAGFTVLSVGLGYHLNYDALKQAASPLWFEMKHVRKRTVADAILVLSVADSKLFQPEAEYLMVDLKHPPDEGTSGPLERAARLMRVTPATDVAAQYIVLLAQAGQVDAALANVPRLRLFARESYAVYRDDILDRTRFLGREAAPLRHELRRAS